MVELPSERAWDHIRKGERAPKVGHGCGEPNLVAQMQNGDEVALAARWSAV